MTTTLRDGEGLRGQVAGQTALCTVGQSGTGLTYRGYDISALAEHATFEEVAYLLLYGELPNQAELDAFMERLKAARPLPAELKTMLEHIPAETNPMDVLRSGVSLLGNLEPEQDMEQQQAVSERLIATLPGMLCYWYRFSHQQQRCKTETDTASLAEHFLSMLHGQPASPLHVAAMNTSLILYAEHEFNASTFTARVVASTLSDLYSCITAAIGALRGPLHGGANEAAMAMIEQWTSTAQAEQGILDMLQHKQKIMGFGHAVYKTSDPRNTIIKQWAARLAEQSDEAQLFAVSEQVEQTMWQEKRLFPNADFYHASTYHFMGIPTELFTPIFVMSRVTGWCAHVFEQRAHNRIIRPSAAYVGPESRPWLAMAQR